MCVLFSLEARMRLLKTLRQAELLSSALSTMTLIPRELLNPDSGFKTEILAPLLKIAPQTWLRYFFFFASLIDSRVAYSSD